MVQRNPEIGAPVATPRPAAQSPYTYTAPEGPVSMKSLLEAGVHFGHQKRR